MFLRAILAVFAALFIHNTTSVNAAELHLNFRQFPAQLSGGMATTAPRWDQRQVKISDYTAARVEATVSREYFYRAADPKWYFGGRYLLYTTGCGTGCQTGVLFDRETGEVMAELPRATSGYEYRRESNLLVVNPTDEEILRNRHLFFEQVTYYFKWTGRNFKFLAAEDWPPYEITGSIN